MKEHDGSSNREMDDTDYTQEPNHSLGEQKGGLLQPDACGQGEKKIVGFMQKMIRNTNYWSTFQKEKKITMEMGI
eukprot:12883456-Prorocentrum_lima.AAC.1